VKAGWRSLVVMACCFGLGCGGGGGKTTGTSDAGGSGATYGAAVLRPNVHVLTDAEKAAIDLMTPSLWTVRGAIDAKPGDILLADTIAVRVQSVSSAGGETTVSVAAADVTDVFSQITLASDLRLQDGILTVGSTDPATDMPGAFRSALSNADGGTQDGIHLSVAGSDSLTIDLARPPFSGSLTFSVGGRLSFDYDGADAARGGASVSGGLGGTARVDAAATATLDAEARIGTLRIPVPFTIADSALRYLGIRVASIEIPISFGAEATASYGIGVQLSAQTSADFSATYDDAAGFSTTGPNYSGSITLSAELPGTGPAAVYQASLEEGVFVRARPQLLILNQVASVGADLKSGIYSEAMVSANLLPPYYCVDAQGHLKGEAFAFFKAVGISEKDSPPLSKDIPFGPRFTAGNCDADAGADGGADDGSASSDADASDDESADDERPDDGGADADAADAGDAGDARPTSDGGGQGGDGAARLPAPPPTHASWIGDPHLRTFDGVRYDCQPAGEETMVVSSAGDLEVQTRTEPWGAKEVSLAVAVAARVASDKVAFYLDGTVTVDGFATTLAPGPTPLPGGGVVWTLSDSYAIVWPDNSQLRVASHGFFFGVDVYVATSRAGQVAGLLGNANGVTEDDLTTRDGLTTLTSPAPFADFYHLYVESWRIASDTSLFDYVAGTSTETFTDRNFPHLLARVQDLDSATVQSNTATCQMNGVTSDWVDACVLDLAMTDGDMRVVEALAVAPPVTATFDVQPPYGGPPAITGVFPQIVGPGNTITILGKNLATVSGDTSNVTVSLVGVGEAGQVTIVLPIVSGSSGELTVATPSSLFQQVSGGATVFVTTPAGSTLVGSPVTIAQSNAFGGNGDGGDGLFAAVYSLQPNTAALPNFGSVDSLTDPCNDPSVIDAPGAGTACPLTTFDVSNLDVPSQTFTAGFPGLPQLTQWFAIRFRGVLTVDTPGNYRFETLSDDGSNAYLIDLSATGADGGATSLTQIVSNDGAHAFGGSLGPTVPLAAGRYEIVIDYFQGQPTILGIELLWLVPGTTTPAIVPASNLQALVPTPPELAGPSIESFGVDPQSLKVDRVSHTTSPITPDGVMDGVFDALVRGPVSAFVLATTDATGKPSGGSYWDTVLGAIPAGIPGLSGGNTPWVIGVQEGGVLPLINNADGSIPILDGGLHQLTLYATTDGSVAPGRNFRLFAIVPGGGIIAGPILTYAAP